MEWLRKFLNGRYFRLDELSIALLSVMVILSISGLIAGIPILSYLADIVFLVYIFRNYSRNIERRIAENAKFMELFGPFFRKAAEPFNNIFNRVRDRKTHIYLKCPSCRQTLRLPKGKGKLKATCPKCKTEFYKTT